MSRSRKPTPKVGAIIDCDSGTVLSPENVWFVLATEEQMEKAEANDSDAFNLAHKKGKHITPAMLDAIFNRDILAMARAFGSGTIETDNSGQYVIYTDQYENGVPLEK